MVRRSMLRVVDQNAARADNPRPQGHVSWGMSLQTIVRYRARASAGRRKAPLFRAGAYGMKVVPPAHQRSPLRYPAEGLLIGEPARPLTLLQDCVSSFRAHTCAVRSQQLLSARPSVASRRP